nr:hypothetical protein [Pandoravirus massiliensis]
MSLQKCGLPRFSRCLGRRQTIDAHVCGRQIRFPLSRRKKSPCRHFCDMISIFFEFYSATFDSWPLLLPRHMNHLGRVIDYGHKAHAHICDRENLQQQQRR